jgi:hypothetical protein
MYLIRQHYVYVLSGFLYEYNLSDKGEKKYEYKRNKCEKIVVLLKYQVFQ